HSNDDGIAHLAEQLRPEGGQHLAECLAVAGGGQLGRQRETPRGALRDASDQYLLLVADQRVELALGTARAVRDLERAGRRIAALHERFEGRLENALPYRDFLGRFLPPS